MRTIALSKVRASQKQAEYNAKALEKIAEMVQNSRLPKIVGLLQEMYPDLPEERVASTVGVLRVTQDTKELEDAVQGGATKSDRRERYGSEWELPCWIAKAIIYDLRAGIDVDNPTRDDLRKSEVFKVASTYQCPKERIEEFINSLSDLSEPEAEEDNEVPSYSEAVNNLHPVIKKHWENRTFHSMPLECYEVLSEVLKAYPDEESWKANSWEQREETVPEILYYGTTGRLALLYDVSEMCFAQ